MKWPPNKAWTSSILRKGFRHFVAINYGGKGLNRWVNLVSVLDGKICFRVSWEEMKDKSQWVSGWEQLPREEANPLSDQTFRDYKLQEEDKDACLHPSEDSGLMIPSSSSIERPWFSEDSDDG